MKNFLALFLLPVLAMSSLSAWAQEAVQEPVQSQTPLFMPTSGWLVGDASAMPAQDASTGGGLPCVMANQYENGFIIRVSGGGGHILAMAVDFRQPAFKPGSSYNVTMGVPPGLSKTVDAMAYNEATLVFNVSDVEGLYKALARGREITLDIAGHSMSFALLNAGEGLRRIEECFYPNAGQAPEMQQAAAPEAPAEQPLQESPQAMNEIAPAAGQSAPELKPQPAVATTYRLARAWASPDNADAAPSPPRDIIAAAPDGKAGDSGEKRWRAVEGTSLREVLGAWAAQARMGLIWMPEQDFPVRQSAGVDGTFEEAVANLLGQYEDESMRPTGKIYDGPESGRKVLLIENGGTI